MRGCYPRTSTTTGDLQGPRSTATGDLQGPRSPMFQNLASASASQRLYVPPSPGNGTNGHSHGVYDGAETGTGAQVHDYDVSARVYGARVQDVRVRWPVNSYLGSAGSDGHPISGAGATSSTPVLLDELATDLASWDTVLKPPLSAMQYQRVHPPHQPPHQHQHHAPPSPHHPHRYQHQVQHQHQVLGKEKHDLKTKPNFKQHQQQSLYYHQPPAPDVNAWVAAQHKNLDIHPQQQQHAAPHSPRSLQQHNQPASHSPKLLTHSPKSLKQRHHPGQPHQYASFAPYSIAFPAMFLFL